MNKSAQGYPGELEAFPINNKSINIDLGRDKPYESSAEMRYDQISRKPAAKRSESEQMALRLLEKGVNARPFADNRLIFPTKDIYSKLFYSNAAGTKAMQETEELVQRNRARLGGLNYEPGNYYTLPYDKIFYGLSKGQASKYNPDLSSSYEVSTGVRAYAPKHYSDGLLDKDDDLSTVGHETSHILTQGPENIETGTENIGLAVNPRFGFGDSGDRAAMLLADKNNGTDVRRRYLKNRYNVDELQQAEDDFESALRYAMTSDPRLVPVSYLNSGPEFTAGASLLRKYMANNGIKSVGVHPTLSHDILDNGTLPFNAAMVKQGLWRENPEYKPGSITQPRYIKGSHVPANPVRSQLLFDASEILPHYNRMQVLINKGTNRSEEEDLELETYQRRLPLLHQLSTTNTGSPSKYYG